MAILCNRCKNEIHYNERARRDPNKKLICKRCYKELYSSEKSIIP